MNLNSVIRAQGSRYRIPGKGTVASRDATGFSLVPEHNVLDVAVIGGGPAGSRAAFRLAKYGYRVKVLEKKSGIGEKPACTGIISRECALIYDIPDSVVLRNINSAGIHSPAGDCIRLYCPETQASILDRPEFDRLLAERASAAGAEYCLSSAAKRISFVPDGVDIETETDGETVHLKSRVAVIASGFNASIAKQAGLAAPGYSVNGAQIEVSSNEMREVAIYFNQDIAPGFFSWIVPSEQGRCLVGLLAHSNPGPLLKQWVASLESGGIIRNDNNDVRYGSIPLSPLKRTCGDRFLVIGDAAGQTKPTTGGGIYFGMLCADIAAETIDDAFKRNDFSSQIMAGYERAWRKKLGNELKTGYYARKIYERLSNSQIEGLLARIKKSGMVDTVLQQKDLSFDWHSGLLLKALKIGAASKAKRVLQLPSGLFRK